MILFVATCITSFALLIALLRRDRGSVGLPIAYLFALLFIHVPGACAHIFADIRHTPAGFTPTKYTEIGIYYTAIASVSFVVGVWLSISRMPVSQHFGKISDYSAFPMFCLVGGLGVTYGLRFLAFIPSIGAVIEKSGSIWSLGVIIGLSHALRDRLPKKIAFWVIAMGVYPVLTLLLGGFLSFGSTPVFVILAALVVSMRSNFRMAVAVSLGSVFLVTLFVSYFLNRDEIRGAVWGGADIETRVEKSSEIFIDFSTIDFSDRSHLLALDQRLNQNYFVGLAAVRIDQGVVGFLKGHSFWEAVISVVPRALWPDKPVYGGSPKIVMEMTGFKVNKWTSYGVGNVMELYINFGVWSLIGGFFLLGFLLGWLDRKTALALRAGECGHAIVFFVPAVVMIQPNGSLVELVAGGGAALIAALGWRWWWNQGSWSNQVIAKVEEHSR